MSPLRNNTEDPGEASQVLANTPKMGGFSRTSICWVILSWCRYLCLCWSLRFCHYDAQNIYKPWPTWILIAVLRIFISTNAPKLFCEKNRWCQYDSFYPVPQDTFVWSVSVLKGYNCMNNLNHTYIIICFACQFISNQYIFPMMTSSNGNFFRVNGPLWGESIGHWWIPLTKASGA